MAAQYTEITLEEMEKFLKRGFHALRPKQGNQRGELYYDLHLGSFVGIRVWTSIGTHSGTGAEVGADAIRVQLVSLKDQGPLERGKAPIVKRTQGWKSSLQDKIEELTEKYEDNDVFWENWASTRSRKGDPEREMKEQEKEEQKEEQKEVEQRKEEPEVLEEREEGMSFQRGDISDKQINYIRSLLGNRVDHRRWYDLGLAKVTGYDHIPNRDEIQTLSKKQGIIIIDKLIKGGHGFERRYASGNEKDFDN